MLPGNDSFVSNRPPLSSRHTGGESQTEDGRNCMCTCCFALFVCLTLLASFFLPSHLSFKNMYVYIDPKAPYTYTYIYGSIVLPNVVHAYDCRYATLCEERRKEEEERQRLEELRRKEEEERKKEEEQRLLEEQMKKEEERKLLEQEMKKEEERKLLAEEEMKREEQCKLIEEEMKKEEACRLLEEEAKKEEQTVNKEVVLEPADTKGNVIMLIE